MKLRTSLIVVIASLVLINIAAAEFFPATGTVIGYFHTDRWGQGVCDGVFVKSELTKELTTKSWRPVSVTYTGIAQPIIPGGALITRIQKVTPGIEPLQKISLTLDKKSINFGSTTKLHVKFVNASDEPFRLSIDDYQMTITVHQRGTHPKHAVERDSIYDSHKNQIQVDARSKPFLRAARGCQLSIDPGSIRMRRGDPELTTERYVEEKPTENGGDTRPFIPAKSSREFIYTLGEDWFVNEYELQVVYYLRDKSSPGIILSPPLSFDVTAKK
ncbi:MAG: hypothetical protein JWN70_1755 [Planctomycetaceae bacterium]|nr:hypothetical protein [Planctomycetaceae bacterium]